MSDFTGQVAIVTGGSRGIGAEISRSLAKQGATVVLSYAAQASSAEQVVTEIKGSGGNATAIQADLSKPGQGAELVSKAVSLFGRLDIVVNNAGVLGPDGDADAAELMFRVNVLGLLEVTDAAIPHLQEGGRILNLSSVLGRDPVAGAAAYSGTKGAVDSITKSYARMLGPKGIRVNAVAPGFTDTDMSASGGPDFRAYAIANTALGRTGTVGEIAAAAVFLLGEEGRWITGEILGVGGGIRI